MEGLRPDSLACRYVASQLAGVPFTVVDVGCSGGIGPVWRLFGKDLLAFGFDPDLDECKRLSAAELLSGVHYIPAFVGLPANHPIALRRGGNPYLQRNPVYLPDFFCDLAIADIDLIKIDVDGPNFDILQTLADSLIRLNVLAVGVEVNFFGSDDGAGHTFHNTDRFMRELGFALAHLAMRPYSKPVNVTSAVANACIGRKRRDFTVPADKFGNPPLACTKHFGARWFCAGVAHNHLWLPWLTSSRSSSRATGDPRQALAGGSHRLQPSARLRPPRRRTAT
jgi:hypothetical protein